MSNLMDVTLSAMNENKYFIAAVPAVGISVSLGYRAVLGVMGLSCKVISKVTDVVGNKFFDRLLSKGMETIGDGLIFHATNDFKRELKIGVALTALTATGVGISILFEQPEFSSWKQYAKVDEFKAFTKPHMEKLANFMEETKPVIIKNYNHAVEWANAQLLSLKGH